MREEPTDADAAAVVRFVERFALDLSDLGMPRMAARVFVTILVTDEGRCTAAHLSESLKASRATVSDAVRYLIQVGLIEREREPGDRRDHYRLHNDLWYGGFVQRARRLDNYHDGLVRGIEAVGADTPAGRRLAETLRFSEFVRDEFGDIMKKWIEVRSLGPQSPPA